MFSSDRPNGSFIAASDYARLVKATLDRNLPADAVRDLFDLMSQDVANVWTEEDKLCVPKVFPDFADRKAYRKSVNAYTATVRGLCDTLMPFLG